MTHRHQSSRRRFVQRQAARKGRAPSTSIWKRSPGRRWLIWLTMLTACGLLISRSWAQGEPDAITPLSTDPAALLAEAPTPAHSDAQVTGALAELVGEGPESWTGPDKLSSTLQIVLMLTVLSMAPAVLLMTTSFVRIIVVLGLLRQALGTQQLPPSQVITSLAMFMTLLIMGPVWKQVYDEAIVPYTEGQGQVTLEDAFARGAEPVKRFMSRQIAAAGNGDDVRMFYKYLPADTPEPEYFTDVPLQVLLPAYMLSELKVAFLIGFQVYLPFLILDVVVASVTISMGMLMLPPVLISLPFKLMLFVLVDGWHLVVMMLLESFGPVT